MNDAKSTITLLACCCMVLTTAPSASADFVGVTSVFPDDSDTVNLCTEGNGDFVPGPLTVCNVYAVFDDPADRLLSAGFADLQVYNGANPDVFYQHPAQEAAGVVRAPGCSQFDPPFGFPDLICDSHITIGLKCSTVPPGDNTATDPDFDPVEFASFGHIVGGWFTTPYRDGTSQGDAGPPPCLQVLGMQLSVPTGETVTGTVTVFALIDGEVLQFNEQVVDCSAGDLTKSLSEEAFSCVSQVVRFYLKRSFPRSCSLSNTVLFSQRSSAWEPAWRMETRNYSRTNTLPQNVSPPASTA